MPTPRPTLLLIEDDAAIASAIVKFLHVQGYEPTHCATGAAALAAIDAIVPDAVITDIHLPDLNGLVLSRTLRDRLGPDVPIIVLSGDTSMAVIKSLSHVGATYFLNKPVNFDLLRERLASFLPAAK